MEINRHRVGSNIHEFLIAGNCEAIIESIKNGSQFQFKLRLCDSSGIGVWSNKIAQFVNIMNSEGEYVYLGVIVMDKETKSVEFNEAKGLDSVNKKLLDYLYIVMWAIVNSYRDIGKIDREIKIIHLGRCARCYKKLNDRIYMSFGMHEHCTEIIKGSL